MSVRPWIAGLTWAVLLVATLVGQVSAQEPGERQPAIILSIAPLERSLPDLTYLLSAMNLSEMVGIFELMSAFYTRGCDRTRPIAVQVFFEGAEPEAQICLPLTDLQLWLGAIASLGRGAEELGEGQYDLLLAGQLVQARVVNDWLYLVPGERRVALPSGDPATLLGDLPDHYCLGARINPRDCPLRSANISLMILGRVSCEVSPSQMARVTQADRSGRQPSTRSSSSNWTPG